MARLADRLFRDEADSDDESQNSLLTRKLSEPRTLSMVWGRKEGSLGRRLACLSRPTHCRDEDWPRYECAVTWRRFLWDAYGRGHKRSLSIFDPVVLVCCEPRGLRPGWLKPPRRPRSKNWELKQRKRGSARYEEKTELSISEAMKLRGSSPHRVMPDHSLKRPIWLLWRLPETGSSWHLKTILDGSQSVVSPGVLPR